MLGKVRIISGKWRGRKLSVPPVEGLRPTPDRVRETVFNWLQPYIPNARCLDLYAGTGILGFEALSRGAASLVMVEQNSSLVRAMEDQANNLGAKGFKIICMDVPSWLGNDHDPFDIIFLDPPYTDKQAGNNIKQLLNCGCLKQGTYMFVECDHELEVIDPRIQIVKSGKAGVVQYRLLRYLEGE